MIPLPSLFLLCVARLRDTSFSPLLFLSSHINKPPSLRNSARARQQQQQSCQISIPISIHHIHTSRLRPHCPRRAYREIATVGHLTSWVSGCSPVDLFLVDNFDKTCVDQCLPIILLSLLLHNLDLCALLGRELEHNILLPTCATNSELLHARKQRGSQLIQPSIGVSILFHSLSSPRVSQKQRQLRHTGRRRVTSGKKDNT